MRVAWRRSTTQVRGVQPHVHACLDHAMHQGLPVQVPSGLEESRLIACVRACRRAGMVAAPRKRTQHAWAFKGAAGASAGGSGGGSSKGVAAYLQDQKDKCVAWWCDHSFQLTMCTPCFSGRSNIVSCIRQRLWAAG